MVENLVALVARRESARRGLSLLVNRKLWAGWNAWRERAREGHEAMELMRRGLAFLVNRRKAPAFMRWRGGDEEEGRVLDERRVDVRVRHARPEEAEQHKGGAQARREDQLRQVEAREGHDLAGGVLEDVGGLVVAAANIEEQRRHGGLHGKRKAVEEREAQRVPQGICF